MGNINDKLNYLDETKNEIKNALISKGISVENIDTFRSYAKKISNINDYFKRYIEKDWENNVIVLPEDLTKIQDYIFYDYGSYSTETGEQVEFKTFSINSFPNNIKLIGRNAFDWYWEQSAIDFSNVTKLSDNLVKISAAAFSKNKTLNITKFPDTLEYIGSQAFRENSKLTDITMLGIKTLAGHMSSYGSFYKCTNLKTVRMGSQLTTMGQYVFNGCTSLEAIYIDLPRATVETLAGYEYAFMNDTTKTGIIICNDDENWVPYTEE